MSNHNTEAQIRASVEAFVNELSALIRAAALESVRDAFHSGSGRAAAPRGQAQPARAAKPKRRRSNRSVDTATVLAAIQANPGTRTEIYAKSLGVHSTQLKAAIDALVNTGQLVRKGKARGTTLHPTARGGAASTAKPASKKKASRKKRGRKRA